jgi:hypothetical protein
MDAIGVKRVAVFVAAMVGLGLGADPAHATFISSAADPALATAITFDFDSEPGDLFFATRTFGGAFTVTADANDLHIDDFYCPNFGTTGNCLDTIQTGGQANDHFRIDFVTEVSAFGFVLNALDTDWVMETYDASDNLLGSYTILSQSPGLSGNNRRGYAGASETTPIAYVTITSPGADDRALIDNFAWVAIPEPPIALLLGLGLTGLAAAGRRR